MKQDIAKLSESGDYEAVIALTIDKSDEESLRFRLKALYETGCEIEALRLLEVHFDRLKRHPDEAFPIHASIIKRRNDKLAGFKLLPAYQALPYHSIVVEEAMQEFALWLHETKPLRTFDVAIWQNLLRSTKERDHLYAVVSIPKSHLSTHLDDFKKLLMEPFVPSIRLAALRRLIDEDIQGVFPYHGYQLAYELEPTLLEAPLESASAQAFRTVLRRANADPATRGLAEELLEQFAEAVYPGEPPYEDEEHLGEALMTLVGRYQGVHRESVRDPITEAICAIIEGALAWFQGGLES